jgi:hypothetical protein
MFSISKNFYKNSRRSKWIIDKRNNNKIDPNLLDTRILVYEDMVKTWFLDIAKYLTIKNKVEINGESIDTNEAGFLIIQIAISYIEGNQQYREGKESKGNSKKFFRLGMMRIFKLRKSEQIDKFYDQVRCGLFHDGMTKKMVTISGEYLNPI